MSEGEVAVNAEEPADGVVEVAVVRRGVVLLDVARIEVVEHIVDTEAGTELDAVVPEREIDGVLNLCIEGEEGWETPRPVFSADEVPVLIDT